MCLKLFPLFPNVVYSHLFTLMNSNPTKSWLMIKKSIKCHPSFKSLLISIRLHATLAL